MHKAPFFDIPPFPGRLVEGFERLDVAPRRVLTLDECLAAAREERVGGAYWARQPVLPAHYLLVRGPGVPGGCSGLVKEHGPALVWADTASADEAAGAVGGACDPWHMLAHAGALLCDADDEVRLVAALLGVPTYFFDARDGAVPWRGEESALAQAFPVAASFASPFGGEPLDLLGLIELSGFWRSLIDSNRSICAGAGFAFWKQGHVLPLLWNGEDKAGFFNLMPADAGEGAVAVWRSKAAPDLIARLERQGTPLVEVEDGFLRSKGLGADCVPPLSITVDRLGAYFDPGQPSELENLLEHGTFDAPLIARAARLRMTIVAAGLGKYESGEHGIERFDPARRHILVAGQVEDDRSILTGGFGLSNLDLLRRVRDAAPDAFLIYKPHPDVVAGHRKGHVPEHIGRNLADKVVTDISISSLIAMVDEVHVNTSLAGFEALMRHKDVTVYGVPFYAGWGLTNDFGPVPERRTAKRSLDELVAATLLVYPRYLDPVSGLPAPAEVVVERLTAPSPRKAGMLVRLRRLQGQLKRLLGAGRAR